MCMCVALEVFAMHLLLLNYICLSEKRVRVCEIRVRKVSGSKVLDNHSHMTYHSRKYISLNLLVNDIDVGI